MNPPDAEPELNDADRQRAERRRAEANEADPQNPDLSSAASDDTYPQRDRRYAELHDADLESQRERQPPPEHAALTEANVQELYRRSQLALNNGYSIARGDDYAAELGGSDGSPAALVELCEARLKPEDESSEASGDDDGPDSYEPDGDDDDGEAITGRQSVPANAAYVRQTLERDEEEPDADPYSEEPLSPQRQPQAGLQDQTRAATPQSRPQGGQSPAEKPGGPLPEEALPGDAVREGEPVGLGYRLKGVVGTLEDVIETLPPSQRTKQTEEAADAVAEAKEELTHKEPDAALGDEHDDTSSDDSPEYEGWSKKKLIQEATTRGLDMKHHINKVDLIALIRASD